MKTGTIEEQSRELSKCLKPVVVFVKALPESHTMPQEVFSELLWNLYVAGASRTSAADAFTAVTESIEAWNTLVSTSNPPGVGVPVALASQGSWRTRVRAPSVL